jgi:soluble lytic murein transglycosylase
MKLAAWLGDQGSVYASALQMRDFFTEGSVANRKGLELLYPCPFEEYVDQASERFNVESNIIWALMKQESAFNPTAKSRSGASGLMQLMPNTAKEEAKRLKMQQYKINDLHDNISLGASYLSRQMKTFGDTERALAAYNAGPGNARKWNTGNENLPLDLWIETITFDETCDYVQRVMGNLHVYRLLYGAP